LGDHDYLRAFYNQAAPQVANLATTLHNQDATGYANMSTVLTSADQQILTTFGNGLAAADKAGLLSPDTVRAFTNPATLWSASMLVKYGPPGSAYGTAEKDQPGRLAQPSLLAQMTNAVFEAQRSGRLQIPIGGFPLMGRNDYDKMTQTLANFDACGTLLQRDSENKAAAWQVMGGKDGSDIAKMLLGAWPQGPQIRYTYPSTSGVHDGKFPVDFTAWNSDHKSDPGFSGNTLMAWLPDQTVANFLDAATSGGRGVGDPKDPNNPYILSAQAAINIIDNTPTPYSENGKPQSFESQAVMRALTNTFMRYLPDIAASTKYDGNSSFKAQDGNNHDGPWVINIQSGRLSSYLMALSCDPNNYGYIKGAVASKMGVALGMKLQGANDGTQGDPYAHFASLYGRLVTEEGNLNFSAAQQKDAENAELNAIVSFGESFVGDVPVVGGTTSKLLTSDQKLAALGFPQIPQFSTDNAALALQQRRQNFSDAELKAMIPIVQGLAQQGIIKTDPSWYQGKQVIPNEHFWQWWRDNDATPIQDKSLPNGPYKHLDEWYQQTYEWMRLQNDAFSRTQ
jgi:hypothetical protein